MGGDIGLKQRFEFPAQYRLLTIQSVHEFFRMELRKKIPSNLCNSLKFGGLIFPRGRMNDSLFRYPGVRFLSELESNPMW